MNPRGVFITLEGGEGVGKSTAAAALAEHLRAEGQEVILTREPGGTQPAEAIRALLLTTDTPFDPLAQTLLHFAARADHVATLIRPALARGAIVICDRFTDSTMAYQAYGMGLDVAAVASLTRLINLRPDTTFILEAPVHITKARRAARGGTLDRYERLDDATQARIALGFRAIATSEPWRCTLIDATQPPAAIVTQMRRVMREKTGR